MSSQSVLLHEAGVSSLRQKADAMLNWGQEVATASEGNEAVPLVVDVQAAVMRDSWDAGAPEGWHVRDCC